MSSSSSSSSSSTLFLLFCFFLVFILPLQALSRSTKRTLYLHIGPHKTGSTHIQHLLTQLHTVLPQYGICSPGQSIKSFHPLAFRLANHEEVNEDHELLSALSTCLENFPVTIISSETFAQLDLQAVQALYKLLTTNLTNTTPNIATTTTTTTSNTTIYNLEIRVLFVYRDWFLRLYSDYGEWAKLSYSMLCTFQYFLTTVFDQHIRKFEYENQMIVKRYEEIFGKESLIILDYIGIHKVKKDIMEVILCEVLLMPCYPSLAPAAVPTVLALPAAAAAAGEAGQEGIQPTQELPMQSGQPGQSNNHPIQSQHPLGEGGEGKRGFIEIYQHLFHSRDNPSREMMKSSYEVLMLFREFAWIKRQCVIHPLYDTMFALEKLAHHYKGYLKHQQLPTFRTELSIWKEMSRMKRLAFEEEYGNQMLYSNRDEDWKRLDKLTLHYLDQDVIYANKTIYGMIEKEVNEMIQRNIFTNCSYHHNLHHNVTL